MKISPSVSPSSIFHPAVLADFGSLTIDTSFEYSFRKRLAVYGSARNVSRGLRAFIRVAFGAHYTHPNAFAMAPC